LAARACTPCDSYQDSGADGRPGHRSRWSQTRSHSDVWAPTPSARARYSKDETCLGTHRHAVDRCRGPRQPNLGIEATDPVKSVQNRLLALVTLMPDGWCISSGVEDAWAHGPIWRTSVHVVTGEVRLERDKHRYAGSPTWEASVSRSHRDYAHSGHVQVKLSRHDLGGVQSVSMMHSMRSHWKVAKLHRLNRVPNCCSQ
jgi:hypothetical protein